MLRKILVTSLALLAFPAFAADISYNYAQFGYQRIDVDLDEFDISIDGDAIGIGGSFEIGENWFVLASYSKGDFDFGLDQDQISAGVGWHTTMSNNSDFYAALQYVRAEVSLSGFESVDEDGIGATIGVRGMVTDNVEIGGSISYIDLGDAGDGTAFGANALYNFTENFAVGLLLGFEDDATSYGAGVRFYW